MWINLFVNGELKMNWHFDSAEYRAPLIEVEYQEKHDLWEEIILKCKTAAGSVIYESERHEMYVNIRSRVQPKDIPDREFNEFLDSLPENRVAELNRQFFNTQ